jgi:pyruvate dehydrogenase E2 component (dihydrolipoamide acetyltransferase)
VAPYELKLPDVGEGLREGTIVEWLVGIGEVVALNQSLVEIETDKSVVEIPAPRAGVVLHRGAAAGATVLVGSLLVVIGDAGESWAPAEESAGAAIAAPLPAEKTGSRARALATPIVRQVATELGVDLDELASLQPGKPVSREAVLSAAAAMAPHQSSARPAKKPPNSTSPSAGSKLSGVRRAIAANLTQAWATPQVTAWDEAPAAELLALRKVLGLPLEALLVEILLPVLVEFPDFSAHFDGETLERVVSPDVGLAIDSPRGLLVAVLREAAELSSEQRGVEVARLLESGAAGTLQAAEMRGQTFTLSNIGAAGGRYGTSIVPVGTTAMLSVGRAADEVRAVDGKVVVQQMMPLGLTFDHRAIDGATAARFLTQVRQQIRDVHRRDL